MGLINSNGNYAIITNTDKHRVDVQVYKDKAEHDAGLNPFFDTFTAASFQCGEDLNTKYSTTGASGAGGKTVADNVILAAEACVAEQAAVDADRHRVAKHVDGATEYLAGDWTVWAAAA